MLMDNPDAWAVIEKNKNAAKKDMNHIRIFFFQDGVEASYVSDTQQILPEQHFSICIYKQSNHLKTNILEGS